MKSMRYDWLDEYLLSKRAVEKDLQADWKWIRYKIGGKMFAAILLDDDDRPVFINLKLEPEEGEFLRGQYADFLTEASTLPGLTAEGLCWPPTEASARRRSG